MIYIGNWTPKDILASSRIKAGIVTRKRLLTPTNLIVMIISATGFLCKGLFVDPHSSLCSSSSRKVDKEYHEDGNKEYPQKINRTQAVAMTQHILLS